MRSTLTLFLLNMFFITFSQNWQLINPGYKYNYYKNGGDIINTTVWTDSVKNTEGDTLFYLNRTFKDCDTCDEISPGKSMYVFYNQPHFLQKEVMVKDSLYTFKGTQIFTIFQKSDSGFS